MGEVVEKQTLIKLNELLTEENIKVLNKTLKLLNKLNELGILDSLIDVLDPEVIDKLVPLILNIHTLRLLEQLDNILEILSSLDYNTIKGKINLINEAVKSIPEKPKPVGLTGLLGALRDPDVQRGLGIVIEVLRKIGEHTRHQKTE